MAQPYHASNHTFPQAQAQQPQHPPNGQTPPNGYPNTNDQHLGPVLTAQQIQNQAHARVQQRVPSNGPALRHPSISSAFPHQRPPSNGPAHPQQHHFVQRNSNPTSAHAGQPRPPSNPRQALVMGAPTLNPARQPNQFDLFLAQQQQRHPQAPQRSAVNNGATRAQVQVSAPAPSPAATAPAPKQQLAPAPAPQQASTLDPEQEHDENVKRDIIAILAETANGCVQELGYPHIVEQFGELHANYQRAMKEIAALKAQCNQFAEQSAHNNATWKKQVAALSAEIRDKDKLLSMKERQNMDAHDIRQMLEREIIHLRGELATVRSSQTSGSSSAASTFIDLTEDSQKVPASSRIAQESTWTYVSEATPLKAQPPPALTRAPALGPSVTTPDKTPAVPSTSSAQPAAVVSGESSVDKQPSSATAADVPASATEAEINKTVAPISPPHAEIGVVAAATGAGSPSLSAMSPLTELVSVRSQSEAGVSPVFRSLVPAVSRKEVAESDAVAKTSKGESQTQASTIAKGPSPSAPMTKTTGTMAIPIRPPGKPKVSRSVSDTRTPAETSSATQRASQRIADSERTPMTDDILEKLIDLHLTLTEDPNSYAFRNPVDAHALDIPHYLNIVQRPMDLATIAEKLWGSMSERVKKGKSVEGAAYYRFVDEFEEDVHLMIDNAALFNGEAHPVTQCGRIVEAVFNKKMRKLKQSAGLSESGSGSLRVDMGTGRVSSSSSSQTVSVSSSGSSPSRKRGRETSMSEAQWRTSGGAVPAKKPALSQPPQAGKRPTPSPLSSLSGHEMRRKPMELTRSESKSRSQSPATPLTYMFAKRRTESPGVGRNTPPMSAVEPEPTTDHEDKTDGESMSMSMITEPEIEKVETETVRVRKDGAQEIHLPTPPDSAASALPSTSSPSKSPEDMDMDITSDSDSDSDSEDEIALALSPRKKRPSNPPPQPLVLAESSITPAVAKVVVIEDVEMAVESSAPAQAESAQDPVAAVDPVSEEEQQAEGDEKESEEGGNIEVGEDDEEEEEEEEDYADLTEDEDSKLPVAETIKGIYIEEDDEQITCYFCNHNIKIPPPKPTFTDCGMRELIMHAKEMHRTVWLKTRNREVE